MDALRKLVKNPKSDESLALGLVAAAALMAIVWKGVFLPLLAGAAVFLIIYGLYPKSPMVALLGGAFTIIFFLPPTHAYEGFEDASGSAGTAANPDQEGDDKAALPPADVAHTTEESAGAETDAKPRQTDGFDNPAPFGRAKPMVPDNRERQEPLVLGKPYKLPSEKDDQGIHLDAGTTFLNAYKALKPDQIAAMTKDTQELLATQKSLVAMLDSFGPMLKDMNKITGFFGMGAN
jgi:hypothetical protein